MTKRVSTIDKNRNDPDTADDSDTAVDPDGARDGNDVISPPVEDSDSDEAAGADTDGNAKRSSKKSMGRRQSRPRLPKVTGRGGMVGLVVVIAIATTVVAIVLGMKLERNSDVNAAGQEALQTAQEYAVVLTSIDTQNLDRDFTRVLDGATGEFKDMYSSSSTQLRQLLVDNQATGSGTVVDAAIKSQSQDKVEVLLFVDQTITNIASPDPRVDRSRIVMTMERVDGRWLAAEVELP